MKADVDVEEIGHRFMVMLIDCPEQMENIRKTLRHSKALYKVSL